MSQVDAGVHERARARPAWLDEIGPWGSLAAVVATLPYTLVYFWNLWSLPHYQFFPLLLIVVGVLAQKRWGGRYIGGWWFGGLRWSLQAVGIGSAVCATVFASPWMGYFAFCFCLAAWLAHRADRETGGSLLYLSVPILLIWQPPYNTIVTADTILIQTLQSLSARLSSQWLDILGYAHHQPGTILEFAGKSFGVAEACSGIQSFFAVVSFAALLSVFFRRGIVHSLCLLATCPCWAILMNTIRITAIPIAYSMFGIDLSHGVLHDILGYCTMALALALMLSTDELLLKLREFIPIGRPTQRATRGLAPALHVPALPVPAAPVSVAHVGAASGAARAVRLGASYTAVMLLGLCCCIQLYDVYDSWGRQRTVIDFFRSNDAIIEMTSADAPSDLLGWQLRDYDQQTRDRGNDDLGQRSDVWTYNTSLGVVVVAFDQMFPGWHELTRCYHNAGWQPGLRSVMTAEAADGWPIVIVELTRDQEYGYLVFSLMGRSSRPVRPPGAYNYWTILEERLRGRLTPAVRGALFEVANYQQQVFVTSNVPLDQSAKDATIERFKIVRQQLWNAAKSRL